MKKNQGSKVFKSYQKLDERGKISFKRAFYRDNKMEELRQMEERAMIAQTIQQSIHDDEGKPYLNVDWIAKHILKLSDKEIKENRNKENK
jgi:hypothetical protein